MDDMARGLDREELRARLVHEKPTGRRSRIVTWGAFQRLVDDLTPQILAFHPDYLLGVLQSGWIVAQALADQIVGSQLLMAAVDANGSLQLMGVEDGICAPFRDVAGTRVVVVDEVVDSGKTMAHFIDEVLRAGASEVATASLVSSEEADPQPTYSSRRYDELPNFVLPWRVFRDFDATVQCLLAAGPRTVEQMMTRLSDLGFSGGSRLGESLAQLGESGRITKIGEEWLLLR